MSTLNKQVKLSTARDSFNFNHGYAKCLIMGLRVKNDGLGTAALILNILVIFLVTFKL